MRQRFGWWLRMMGDRVSPDTGPRHMSSHTFTIEDGRGIVFRTDGRGCPLWHNAEDYDRAHDEADTEHTVVLWGNLAAGRGPKTRRAGGRP
jgi:hypothetical protein